jgi:hypothetical protein
VVVVVLPVAVKEFPPLEKISVTLDCIFHATGPLLPLQASWTCTPLGTEVISGGWHCIAAFFCFQKSEASSAQTLCWEETDRPSTVTVEFTFHSPALNAAAPLCPNAAEPPSSARTQERVERLLKFGISRKP